MRITALGETQRSFEVGEAIVLQCDISDPMAPVTWFKDGVELCEADGQQTLAESSKRALAIQSATPCHSGIYSCQTTHDSVQFHVDVKGDESSTRIS